MLGVLAPVPHAASMRVQGLGARCFSTSVSSLSVRVRFAPSPTGSLHLGGLRTALANHLLAKNKGGQWLVRIEDTDRTRLSPGAVESLAHTLAWAGLKPDAAPWLPPEDDSLQVGPYHQSERLPLYRAAALELVRQGKAYYDFRAPSEASSASTGAYTPLPLEEARKLVEAGTPHTIRLFRPDKADDLSYDDLIYGHLRFSADVEFAREGDVVLLKRDGYPTYHLASVVDDHAMGITHVLRGEEWIASLPTHLRLYEALGYAPPQFAHLPLLMTADGRKLSKRHNDASVESYIERGFEPAALVNFVALLGYNHKHRTDHSAPTYVPIVERNDQAEDLGPGEEVFTLSQMEADYDLSRISSTRSSPDLVKLEFLNRAHIRFALLSGPEAQDGWASEYVITIQRARDFLEKACGDALTAADKTEERIRHLTLAFIERAHTLPEAAAKAATLLNGPNWNSAGALEFRSGIDSESYRLVLTKAREVFAAQPDELSEADMASLVDQIAAALAEGKSSKERKKLKGILMRSLRHAAAGEKVGPPLPSLLHLLGPGRLASRLEDALASDQK